jgi:hypothetical protein
MMLHKITEFCTDWLNVYSNITLQFCTIDMFKILVIEHNDSSKTCRNVHISLQENLIYLSATVNELSS